MTYAIADSQHWIYVPVSFSITGSLGIIFQGLWQKLGGRGQQRGQRAKICNKKIVT